MVDANAWCAQLSTVGATCASLTNGLRYRNIQIRVSSGFETRVLSRADAGERGKPIARVLAVKRGRDLARVEVRRRHQQRLGVAEPGLHPRRHRPTLRGEHYAAQHWRNLDLDLDPVRRDRQLVDSATILGLAGHDPANDAWTEATAAA